MALLAAIAVLDTSRPPQKFWLTMLGPAVFFAPGIIRQSQATVFEIAEGAAITLPQLQQPCKYTYKHYK
jgi:hypothetical protein